MSPTSARRLPEIYAQMAAEGTRYFVSEPAATRRRYLWAGQWFVILAVVGAVVGVFFMRRYGYFVFLPSAALGLLGSALMVVSRWMPRRTPTGAEEAERWQAFKRYLASLKEYGDVDAAQTIIDRYFAYAIALDVEEVLLRQAADLGAPLPTWSEVPTWSSPSDWGPDPAVVARRSRRATAPDRPE